MAIRKTTIRSYCKKCDSQRLRKKPSINDQKRWDHNKNKRMRTSTNIHDVARCIYKDSRKSDKNKKRQNDLTLDIIKEMIKNGCAYCDAQPNIIRMTLDRIDNSIGHVKNNLKPACIRCNYIRRDMPFEAWILMSVTLKQITQSGKFGTWIGGWRGGSNTKT